MKLLSVNAGQPREITSDGTTVFTAIWKYPLEGRVRVSSLNVEGDGQANSAVHGGIDKAVYLYPSEHYALWRRELRGVPEPGLVWGAFGENLTTEGLFENRVRIGDRLVIGTAEFAVSQPRMPCAKLGIRFGRPEMLKEFLASRRSGFYLRVVREGELAAGDSIEHVPVEMHGLTVTDVVEAFATGMENPELVRRLAELPSLAAASRSHFQRRLDEAGQDSRSPAG